MYQLATYINNDAGLVEQEHLVVALAWLVSEKLAAIFVPRQRKQPVAFGLDGAPEPDRLARGHRRRRVQVKQSDGVGRRPGPRRAICMLAKRVANLHIHPGDYCAFGGGWRNWTIG